MAKKLVIISYGGGADCEKCGRWLVQGEYAWKLRTRYRCIECGGEPSERERDQVEANLIESLGVLDIHTRHVRKGVSIDTDNCPVCRRFYLGIKNRK